MNVLVINAGSSSLKYQLIDMATEQVRSAGVCDRIALEGSRLEVKLPDGNKVVQELPLRNHKEAFLAVQQALTTGQTQVIASLDEIHAVGHRVVQGGAKFKQSVRITAEVLAEIDRVADLAPLHNPVNLQGILACTEAFGAKMPQVAVFDTAFHAEMPPEAYMFAIPYEYYEKYGIRRYGFHGTSHKFVSDRCATLLGQPLESLKLITCHLGNGSSIAAVQNGRSVDTTMGLTPLDGFLMGTRSGGLDPSVVLYLQKKENLDADAMSDLLNKQSGALGVSGVSSDDRDLHAAANEGNARAALARSMQRYQVRKRIGAYAAAMNGVDAIVFTGGIGENTFDLRQEVCENLSFLGVRISAEANQRCVRGVEGAISLPGSAPCVWVIPTNEELLIARDTAALV